MQQVVLKLDFHEDKNCKQKAMELVSSIPGIESISMDTKERMLTIIGDMDPIALVKKLRKNFCTKIESIGPAKEPEKPKAEPAKPKKPEAVVHVTDMNAHNCCPYNRPICFKYSGYYPSVEETPNGCVIC